MCDGLTLLDLMNIVYGIGLDDNKNKEGYGKEEGYRGVREDKKEQ
jgi:hypothetical protein